VRTNNPLERIIREFRRRTRVAGAFRRRALGADAGPRQAPAHRFDQPGKRRYLAMEMLLNPAKQEAAA
jgi:hypothetical protein